MPQTITRKCTKCKEQIVIDVDNISGIVRYKDLFYHSACFVEYCQGRAAKKSSSPVWQQLLNDMSPVENAAKEKISYKLSKDRLNEYLLSHYDVVAVPDRFWNVVAEIENGEYKQKKCNPVSISMLLDVWKWGQKNLDIINRNNKKSGKGPKDDNQRISYDLAILVGKVPNYLKQQAKRELEEAERKAMEKENLKIDYNRVQAKKEETGLGDISNLLDDLI